MLEHIPDPWPTPTVQELAAMGSEFARPTDWVKGDRKNDPPKPTRWHITQRGHDLMGEAMRRNALEAIARGEGNWVRPPSRDDLTERILRAAAERRAAAIAAAWPHCQHCPEGCDLVHDRRCQASECEWMEH